MTAANDLIERLERETGQRIDDNDGDNLAMAGLFGAIARAMGQTPSSYRPSDDVAAGVLILHQMTPEYEAEQASKQMIADLLVGGVSPDTLKDITG